LYLHCSVLSTFSSSLKTMGGWTHHLRPISIVGDTQVQQCLSGEDQLSGYQRNRKSTREVQRKQSSWELTTLHHKFYGRVMEEQGLKIEESTLNQDNLSAMILEKNGKESSSIRTTHIRVRYFFIKDRITSGDITLKHCPATEVLSDHFTKPLQGGMFRKFRAEIQGISVDIPDSDVGRDRGELMAKSPSDGSTNTSPQECVGKDENPAKPFRGYARTDGRKERREAHGGLARPRLTAAHIKAGGTYWYAEAVKRGGRQ
jgi:hypothetical protein